MKSFKTAKIINNKNIFENIYDMELYQPEIAENAVSGQFLNLYTGHAEHILPRPISICEINKSKGSIRILYQVVGKGTEIFSKLEKNSDIKVLGPLGNGFTLNKAGNHIVIGGGIGVPPLLELVKGLQGKVCVFIGSRSVPILKKDFENFGANVYIASDNGISGFHGNVMQLVRKINPKTDYIYACGPKVMLKSVSDWAFEKKISAQLSMEERMACGVGACVGCVVKIRKNESNWENMKVCKEGPVFLSSEVVWD